VVAGECIKVRAAREDAEDAFKAPPPAGPENCAECGYSREAAVHERCGKEACEIKCHPFVAPPPDESAQLHPTGRCTCANEGRCDWCTKILDCGHRRCDCECKALRAQLAQERRIAKGLNEQCSAADEEAHTLRAQLEEVTRERDDLKIEVAAFQDEMREQLEGRNSLMVQRDSAQAEAKRLREALTATAKRKGSDGTRCWCLSWPGPDQTHCPKCEDARAALAPEVKT